jgi:hypothetical protein
MKIRGALKSYLCKHNSELHKLIVDIQTAHDKVCSQNGNSREHILRSQNWLLSEIKEVIL